MAENTSGGFWSNGVMEPSLTAQEKELRDKFVDQFLYDSDAYQACIRLGFLSQFALDWAKRFMSEPYVLKRIREAQTSKNSNITEQRDELTGIVLAALKEAAQRGPYASRVAAAREIKAMLGLDAPTKSQQEVIHRGGVMMVPAISNLDEWEQEALATQGKLVQEARH